ncbi:MAG: hypothetical protein NC412_11645 [Roseburia sp.]|nr:hypothetical protein [Roseburia sp.]MCM1279438.1 hypothetical protein [Robinsoniella sp.]
MRIGKMLIAGLVCGTLFLAGCGKEVSTDEFVIHDSESVEETESNAGDDEASTKTEYIGTLQHGVNWTSDEKDYSFVYKGGALEIPYFMQGSGICTSVGFLVYMNGIPQPYMIKDREEEYKYMHIIEGAENQNVDFTISFIPVTGKNGDKASIQIVSVANPSFIPDMTNTFDYGMSHQALEANYAIVFQENAEAMPKVDDDICLLKTVYAQSTEIDKDEMEYMTGEAKPDLDTYVYADLKIDGASMLLDRKSDILDKDTVHVAYIMMGHPGIKYRVCFYLNHQLLTDESGEVCELELATGKMNILEFDMDVSQVRDASFYAVAIPVNAEDYPDDPISTMKFPSIHLYRGEN